MKFNPFVSALVIAAGMTAPTVLFGAAADLNSCCTPGDKDMPKSGGNLGNQSYSSLSQVNRSNINALGPVWKTSTSAQAVTQPVARAGSADSGQQTTPIIVDGVIYLDTPAGGVIAVDGATGASKWKWEPTTATGAPFGTTGTRRGVSIGEGKVYTLAAGNRVVALNKDTGALVWAVQPVGPVSALFPAGEPLGNIAKVGTIYTDGIVFVQTNDGNNVRNAAFAVKASDGTQLWSFFGAAEPGRIHTDVNGVTVDAGATWGPLMPDGRSCAMTAGASPWLHGSVDPELGLYYVAFGNIRTCGSSQDGQTRPGDNLFGNSIVALDMRTGAYKWHHQSVRHDIFDMDNVQPPVLMDVPINGVMRKMLAYGSKTGMYYMLDRTDGSAPLGIDEIPVPQDPRQASWPTQPFPRQGGYTEQCAIWEPLGGPVPGNPSRAVPNYPLGCLYAPHWDGPPVLSFPGHGGAADWSHRSFSQTTKLVYTGMGYVGASHSLNEGSNGLRPPGEYQTGAVVAVDPSTNLVRWKKLMPYSLAHGNGILTTATDVLFIGQPDGNLIAMDATSGRELWRFQTGAAISASPITYEIEGVQYVAVYGGGTGIPYGNSAPRGDNLWALKVGGTLPPAPTPTPPEVRRPVSGSAVTGASVSNTVLLGRSSATAAEQSINSGNTNGMFPTWMTVPVGTTVTFTNPASSVNAHCATQFFEGLFNFRLNPGQSATYTFTQAGEFFFNDCHNPRSTGKVVVQ
jgi:glucose dehydrogenase/plastocyanin